MFLFVGFNIFASAFFTALNDGLTSAILSTTRILILPTIAVLALPIFFDVDGVWLTAVVAEALSLGLSIFYFIFKRKRFNY